ncbi:MAG: hypothetical protein IJA54_00665 [Tyzzerella sp.]|nr:hypothetical protein [Tyzzerella sp.]
MTEKLFYKDSHMITFSAVVTACEKVGDYYEAVLDRTAFFPEGGGQYADTGSIDGVKVLDAQERDGVIYHKVERELPVGKQVEGTIDWEERFSKMQHHSGEHIVSGLVNAIYGYDNVGFHMGKDAVTMDFNGVLSKGQLREIEHKANEAVVKNLDIQVLYPSKEELAEMQYRSKIEIEGQVRIVVVPGYDTCACCAPHVNKSGEIGLIKLIGVQNYKGGVRVSMLCGFRAIEDYERKSESTKSISVMLSAKEDEIVDEVAKLKEELATQKGKVAEVQKTLLQYKVQTIAGGEPLVVLFESDLSGDAPRELVNLLLSRGTGVGAVFAETGHHQYRYVLGSKTVDVRPMAKMLNEQFAGRGGGKPEMVQGSVSGDADAIREAVELCRREMY